MPTHVKRAQMIRWALPLLVAFLGLSGCASSHGLSREVLQDEIRQEESRFIDTSTTAAAPVRPHASQLGLYLKPTGFLHREFEWTSRDRDAVLAWSKRVPLKSAGFLTLSSLKGHTLTELRAAATRYGVDWLLVFDGAAAVDRYNNYKAALWYWTILGAYVADGTQTDVLCLLKATLWDVKTGARLFEEQMDAKTEKVGPAALVEDKTVLELAKARALEELTRRLDTQLKRLH
ncbi:MAG TPA: hypothetical protein VFX36_08180 [Nitrospira sp.]|nr:hypothetical protein [Nitrospira sp.]